MDETTQETLFYETAPLPSEDVPATSAVTVPVYAPTYAPVDIYSNVYPAEYTPEETVPATTEPVYIELIESVGTDIVHSSLFGSFLICDTLVGLALFRRLYGT